MIMGILKIVLTMRNTAWSEQFEFFISISFWAAMTDDHMEGAHQTYQAR
jgi:hypothetical protein